MVSYLYPACALNTLRYFRWQDAFSFLQGINNHKVSSYGGSSREQQFKSLSAVRYSNLFET